MTYADVTILFLTRTFQKFKIIIIITMIEIIIKIVNVKEENLHLLYYLSNVNEFFRKVLTYGNIRSHNKPEFHPIHLEN